MLTSRGTATDRGAVAVEFAILLVPFLALLFGMIQYGMYFYSAQTGTQAANAALRQVAVGNCQNSDELLAFVNKQLGASAVPNTASVSTTFVNPDGSAPAAPAAQNVLIGGRVTLTLTFKTTNMHFPFVPFLSDPSVTRTVQARVEDTTDEGCAA